MTCHNTTRILLIRCHLMNLGSQSECLNIEKSWNEVDLQLFKKLTTESIKAEGKLMHSKLKTWKERIIPIQDG